VSPSVFQWRGYRFFFFSREERRPHVHVSCADGEAKFRLEPRVELARNFGLSEERVTETRKVVEARRDEIIRAWRKHLPG
jgi:hypothetical protein